MPGPNPPTPPVDSVGLNAMTDEVVVSSAVAVNSLSDYEQATPPKDKSDVCEDFNDLKGKLQSMLNAINATMADLGCGII